MNKYNSPVKAGKPRTKREHSPKISKNAVKSPNFKYTCTGPGNAHYHHLRDRAREKIERDKERSIERRERERGERVYMKERERGGDWPPAAMAASGPQPEEREVEVGER